MRRSLASLTLGLAAFTSLLAADQMRISSPSFQSGAEIPAKFSCTGANVSPELQISGAPSGAKTLVLIVEDPDAPSGLFTHWLVWNIDPQTTKIAENTAPPGAVQGTNDFSKRGYRGPCPPSGTHRYFFRILALDKQLDLKPGAKRYELDKAVAGHVIGRGDLMVRYAHK
jgi:Raf kinase inhibitor-like YbhB/YbcL family protein